VLLEQRLGARQFQGLLRVPHEGAYPPVSFCSNDYLGFGAERVRLEGLLGARASRLVSGQVHEHRELEQGLAEWLQLEDALVFTSGYLANQSTLAAIVRPGDRVLSDALNHASLIDGIRLSGVRAEVFPHNDLEALRVLLAMRPEASATVTATWVVTESYHSMDAGSPNLAALRALCMEHGAHWVLDETHAVGLFGPEGRGLAAREGVVPDVFLGAFGKALGAQGGFVAGPRALRTYLWNYARGFIFSTGLSPVLAKALVERVAAVRAADDRRTRVHALASDFRTRASELLGSAALLGHGPIVPWQLGASAEAERRSQQLASLGMFVYPIRPPTVPEGTSRLRMTLTASHTEREIETLLSALEGFAP
jgi:8-amino-7-oxononanoate synthase